MRMMRPMQVAHHEDDDVRVDDFTSLVGSGDGGVRVEDEDDDVIVDDFCTSWG